MIRRSIILTASIFGLLILSATMAEDVTDEPAPTTIGELQSEVEKILAEFDVPAIGIAMVDDQGPVWLAAFGKSNLENDTDVTTDSMFRTGSTTKMFVALAVLKLVEEGRLSLDDKVSDLAPEIEFQNQWEDTDPVRVVHLLEHTTGWDDNHLPEYAHNDPTPTTLKQGLDFHPHSRVTRWKPGSRMAYCNSGPPVAAYIVGKIVGQDFEDYVQEQFFEPMGMDTMTFRLSEDMQDKGVTLYMKGEKPEKYWHISMRPAGSINASSADMQKMVSFFVNRGRVGDKQLITEDSLKRMELPESTPAADAGLTQGYGLHNYTSVYENWVYHGHNGGVNGGLTELAYLPNEKLGYVFMINSGNGVAFGKFSDLIRNYQTRDLGSPIVATGNELTQAQRDLVGYYFPINPRQENTRFLERVLGIHKFWVEGSTLKRKGLLGGSDSNYLAASPTLFVAEKTGVPALAMVDDPLAGPVIHIGSAVFKSLPKSIVYGQFAVLILWVLTMVSTIVFMFVWGIRYLNGKIASGPAILVRLWPLLATLAITIFIFMILVAAVDPFSTLAKPTFFSVMIMITTILYAVFAVVGVGAAISYRNAGIHRVAYWYSALSSFLYVLVAVYFFNFGMIGFKTWA